MGRYIWREQEGRGGHPCRACKMEKERAEHIENCVEFWRVLGMNVQDWLMGLRGQIDETTGEDQEDRRRPSGRLKKREQVKKPKTHTGYG